MRGAPWEGPPAYFFRRGLRPAASVFAALVSFFSRVRGLLSALPAALSCFLLGFLAMFSSFRDEQMFPRIQDGMIECR
jgi:hypothetical protein